MPTQAQPQAARQPLRTPLADRPLLAPEHAAELRNLFKVLANDSRLRLLHALQREGELCVGELAERVGMSPQAVSNQLGRLADRRIVAARRAGNFIYYRIVDPCVPGLLDLGICLLEETGHATAAGGRR
jgi:ArsR family transcriptional regulator, lead/cadmium/zinc/bismuth-responsive transcriptional repressor